MATFKDFLDKRVQLNNLPEGYGIYIIQGEKHWMANGDINDKNYTFVVAARNPVLAKQWAEFCSQPGYVINAIGKSIFADYHQEIVCPITSIWASDDEIATQANVKDLLRLYPNAQTNLIELKPQQYGYKQIGHMLMFKKSHQKLWPVLEKELRM